MAYAPPIRLTGHLRLSLRAETGAKQLMAMGFSPVAYAPLAERETPLIPLNTPPSSPPSSPPLPITNFSPKERSFAGPGCHGWDVLRVPSCRTGGCCGKPFTCMSMPAALDARPGRLAQRTESGTHLSQSARMHESLNHVPPPQVRPMCTRPVRPDDAACVLAARRRLHAPIYTFVHKETRLCSTAPVLRTNCDHPILQDGFVTRPPTSTAPALARVRTSPRPA